jgi:hypothetical protein
MHQGPAAGPPNPATAFFYTGCHKYVPFARFANKRNVCKNEEKLLERLDQTILDVIDNPEKTQQTTAIGTLF